jgi:DNA-directed RNA polymerase specialized sigma24 family protein
MRRLKCRRPKEAQDREGDCVEEGVDHETPEDLALSSELADLLDHEIARRPETYRTAFELVRFEGLSMGEAAGRSGTSANAVKVRAHRAYDLLRHALARATHVPPASFVHSP